MRDAQPVPVTPCPCARRAYARREERKSTREPQLVHTKASARAALNARCDASAEPGPSPPMTVRRGLARREYAPFEDSVMTRSTSVLNATSMSSEEYRSTGVVVTAVAIVVMEQTAMGLARSGGGSLRQERVLRPWSASGACS